MGLIHMTIPCVDDTLVASSILPHRTQTHITPYHPHDTVIPIDKLVFQFLDVSFQNGPN